METAFVPTSISSISPASESEIGQFEPFSKAGEYMERPSAKTCRQAKFRPSVNPVIGPPDRLGGVDTSETWCQPEDDVQVSYRHAAAIISRSMAVRGGGGIRNTLRRRLTEHDRGDLKEISSSA